MTKVAMLSEVKANNSCRMMMVMTTKVAIPLERGSQSLEAADLTSVLYPPRDETKSGV